MNLGFIGLGNMGSPICQRLVDASHRVVAYDLDVQRVLHSKEGGAHAASSAREVAEESDVIFLSLPNHTAVRDVVLGSGGVLASMRPGTILVDLSTSLPSITLEIGRAAESRAVKIVDAPVSGGIEGAEAGTLSIFAGGDKAAIEQLAPLFNTIGDPDKFFHIGALGAGHSMKLIHSHLNAITLVAISEALVVGRKAGIDPQMMFDVISVSRGNSGMFQSRAPRMLDGDFSTAFSVDLMHKDLTLAAGLAQDHKVPIVVGEAARAVFEIARASGRGADDIAAIVTILENWAGVTVRRRNP
ncbi:MAG: NAD(P)-dependent oxidoreductase [Burkholderiales bacterium]